jgi:alkylation response protein AidB-like acyl-CoA dehydrogenase
VNLNFTAEERAFRAECRSWLEANIPTEPLASGDTRDGFFQHVAWEKKLFAAGWAVVSWPEEYGGRGATLMEWLIFEEEYYRAGAPARVTQNGIFLLAPTLFEFGTEAQKARILRPMAAAETLWGQAWSEPEAGSDLANVKSTARRVDGGWRLRGQKTWCTRGAFCDGIYGLFRTDPDSERHRGLTYFMVPLDAEGITVRGVERLDGDESFAEIFLDDVFVADTEIIGGVDQGWKVAMATTSSERGLSLRSPGRFIATATRLIALWNQRKDPRLRDQVVRMWMDAQAYRLYTFQTVTRMMQGGALGADSSLNKIFWSEMDIAGHETALELLGGDAEIDEENRWLRDYMFALAGPIYAGTNEVQRMIVARRVLELPR